MALAEPIKKEKRYTKKPKKKVSETKEKTVDQFEKEKMESNVLSKEIPVTSEFVDENKKLNQTMSKSKKGGPYSKGAKESRRNEVYRLHFEYGYSGRKIADLMKVARNTINSDIDFWYSKIVNRTNIFNPENAVLFNLERLENQRTRIREQLDKTKSFQEKNTLDRFIFEIDSKILNTYLRLTNSNQRVFNLATEKMNNWLEENNHKERYMTLFDKMSVSNNAFEEISEIINNEKKTHK